MQRNPLELYNSYYFCGGSIPVRTTGSFDISENDDRHRSRIKIAFGIRTRKFTLPINPYPHFCNVKNIFFFSCCTFAKYLKIYFDGYENIVRKTIVVTIFFHCHWHIIIVRIPCRIWNNFLCDVKLKSSLKIQSSNALLASEACRKRQPPYENLNSLTLRWSSRFKAFELKLSSKEILA